MSTFYNVVDAAGYPLIKCAGVIEFADDRQSGEDWAIEYADADEAAQDAAKFGGTVETYQRPTEPSRKDKAISEAIDWINHWECDVECGLKPTPDSLQMVKAKLSSVMEAAE